MPVLTGLKSRERSSAARNTSENAVEDKDKMSVRGQTQVLSARRLGLGAT